MDVQIEQLVKWGGRTLFKFGLLVLVIGLAIAGTVFGSRTGVDDGVKAPLFALLAATALLTGQIPTPGLADRFVTALSRYSAAAFAFVSAGFWVAHSAVSSPPPPGFGWLVFGIGIVAAVSVLTFLLLALKRWQTPHPTLLAVRYVY